METLAECDQLEIKSEKEDVDPIFQFPWICEEKNIKHEGEVLIQSEVYVKLEPEPDFLLSQIKLESTDKRKNRTRKVAVRGKVPVRKKFTCKLCVNSFSTKKQLIIHKRSHPRFTCSECGKSFMSQDGHDHHRKTHEAERCNITQFTKIKVDKKSVFSCNICGRQCSKISRIKIHILHFHIKKQFNARMRVLNEFNLPKPLKMKNLKVEDPDDGFTCDHCGRHFTTKSLIRCHIDYHSTEYCTICAKKFSKISLKRHMQKVHDAEQLVCPICGKTSKGKHNLKDHMKIHDKKFVCSSCEQKFPTRCRLKQHEKWHENPDIYKCTICNIAYDKRSTFRLHNLSQHVVGKRFLCDLCGYGTFYREGLRSHMKIHFNPKRVEYASDHKYKCPICWKNLKNADTLRCHKLTHNRKFVCHFCNRKFLYEFRLKEHLMWHENSKVFKCEKCGGHFKDRAILRIHQKKTKCARSAF